MFALKHQGYLDHQSGMCTEKIKQNIHYAPTVTTILNHKEIRKVIFPVFLEDEGCLENLRYSKLSHLTKKISIILSGCPIGPL